MAPVRRMDSSLISVLVLFSFVRCSAALQTVSSSPSMLRVRQEFCYDTINNPTLLFMGNNSCGTDEKATVETVPTKLEEGGRVGLLSRRHIIGATIMGTLGLTSRKEPALARDEIFKSNILTNPILEQVRIWEQAEADDLKYGGELTPGNAGNRGKVEAYSRLLVPIVEMNMELLQVNSLVHTEGVETTTKGWKSALSILEYGKYDKIAFKKVFNAYGDNIYYSDPDRANAYLGGGATPSNEQSLAYLLRNDVLTNVEDLRAELEYLLKSGEDDREDLYKFADGAVNAMKRYLAIVPPTELEKAQQILATK